MSAKIKSHGDALEAIEAIRAWAGTKLPAKQPQPWNGHSPEQCMLINALAGLTTATFNLNRYQDLLISMAGEKGIDTPRVTKTRNHVRSDDNPLL